MIDDTAISEFEVDCGWENQRMLVTLKSLSGKLWIDARKWTFFKDGSFKPKNGLMLSLQHWPPVIARIQSILAEHNCNT